MADVFISYSRKDLKFVRKLQGALAARQRDTWVDWKGIPPTAEWLEEIFAAIVGADAFLFVLSPDSVTSEICQKELSHAVLHKKRLIPVVYRKVDSKDVSDPLAKVNWIFLRESDDFDLSIEKLLGAVDTDLEWVKAHTRLLTRAIEWHGKGRDKSHLLRGRDLKEAVSWMSLSGEKEPRLTDLQGQYILASRQGERKRQRFTLSIVTAGLLIAIALAVTASIQYLRADERGRIALSRQLAVQAENLLDSQIDLALLLSVEAYNIKPMMQTKGTLLTAIQKSPQLARIQRAHKGHVLKVAFSPDGKLLASGSRDHTVIIWNIEKGRPLGPPLDCTGSVWSLAFSPDGKILASAGVSDLSDGESITLWDLKSLQPLGSPLDGHKKLIGTVAFSPDGKLLASGSMDKTIIFWDMEKQQALGSPLLGHQEDVTTVAFSPDGKLLASGSYDRTIRIWDVETRQLTGKPLASGQDNLYCIAFSPDGKLLVSGSEDNTIRFWDVEKCQSLGPPLKGHEERQSLDLGGVLSVAFSPDGKLLASGSYDRTIRLWDVATQQLKGPSLKGHQDTVFSVAFSPDGKLLASGSFDKNVMLWDVEKRHTLDLELKGHQDTVNSVAFSPDGKLLASGSGDNTIRLWDMEKHQLLRPPLKGYEDMDMPTDLGGVYSVAFSPDGKLLASGGLFNTIRLWDVGKGLPLGVPLEGHDGVGGTSIVDTSECVTFSPDGKLLASGSNDGSIMLWDIATLKSLGPCLKGHNSGVYSVAFSPDSQLLASGSWDQSIILWDLKTLMPIGPPLKDHEGSVICVDFSPDGRLLASGSRFVFRPGKIILWDVKTRSQIVTPIEGHTRTITSIDFAPGGHFFASASVDGTIMLWDLKMYERFGPPLIGHEGRVESVAFSPDGHTMASGGEDGTVRIWDMDVESWLRRACSIANRNLSREEWSRYLGADIPYRKTCSDLPGY